MTKAESREPRAEAIVSGGGSVFRSPLSALAQPDPDEGWFYDLESPSAEEIRRRFAGPELGPEKLRIEQWRHLVGAIERLGRLASLLVDPRSDLATWRASAREGDGDEVCHGAIAALVAAVSEPWTEPPGFDRGLALRSAMGSLAIAAGIQLQLDVRAER